MCGLVCVSVFSDMTRSFTFCTLKPLYVLRLKYYHLLQSWHVLSWRSGENIETFIRKLASGWDIDQESIWEEIGRYHFRGIAIKSLPQGTCMKTKGTSREGVLKCHVWAYE